MSPNMTSRKRPRGERQQQGEGDAIGAQCERTTNSTPREGRNSSSGRRHRHQSRPPLSEPPESLVRLLQSDADVLQYFQSLQANLVADVQVWKDRARNWQNKYELQQQQQKKQVAKPGPSKKGTKASKSNASKYRETDAPDSLEPPSASKSTTKNGRRKKAASSNEKSPTAANHSKNPSAHYPEAPEDQYMLESSTDEDDNFVGKEADVRVRNNYPTTGAVSNDTGHPLDDALLQQLMEDDSSSSSSQDDLEKSLGADMVDQGESRIDEDEWEMQRRLWDQAVSFLRDELGVACLEIILEKNADGEESESKALDGEVSYTSGSETKMDEVTGMEHTDPAVDDTTGIQTSKFTVLLDPQRMVSDIYAAVRMICRIQMLDPDLGCRYGPFDPITLLPATDGPSDHHDSTIAPSASAGNSRDRPPSPPHPAIRAKAMLRKAIAVISSLPPQLFHNEHQKVTANAKEIQKTIHKMIESLKGELSQGWACHDRAELWSNPALLMEEESATHIHALGHNYYKANEEESGSTHEMQSNGSKDLVDNIKNEDLFLGCPKSQTRLSSLLERYWLSRLVFEVLILQDQSDDAYNLLVEYVVSSLPTLQDGSRKPPILSFVLLRGMLHANTTERTSDRTAVGRSTSWLAGYLDSLDDEQGRTIFTRVLALACQRTAMLYNSRLHSKESRIVDLARVELASYQDLLRHNGEWLCGTLVDQASLIDKTSPSDVLSSLRRILQELGTDIQPHGTRSFTALHSTSLQMALVLNGDVDLAIAVCKDSLRGHNSLTTSGETSLMAAQATRHLILRKLDILRDQVGQIGASDASKTLPWSLAIDTSSTDTASALGSILDCADVFGDADLAIQVVGKILSLDAQEQPVTILRQLYDGLQRACVTPLVRVVNLEWRRDRYNSFRAQCLRENLFCIQAGAKLVDPKDLSELPSVGYYFGQHALDGTGRAAEVMERFTQYLTGASKKLKSLVNVEWCPNDLKPFDKDAPDHEGLVKMSDSEIACALSHIASWKGALRSFQLSTAATMISSSSTFCRHPDYMRRLFRLGGFAHGPALLASNDDMAPAPVCIILEDDAILVDRFRDRLDELFQELPRDFHFCALGYGRPKSAPIYPCGRFVGIPSHQFYLTGYLVSELGCQYLLQSLPVVGPVDSWIGLQQTRNWDNVFGVHLGVGSNWKPYLSHTSGDSSNGIIPTRKDLGRIMQFRAYCARVPLCSQKVGRSNTASGVPAVGATATETRSWRMRDTDIVYSGVRGRSEREST